WRRTTGSDEVYSTPLFAKRLEQAASQATEELELLKSGRSRGDDCFRLVAAVRGALRGRLLCAQSRSSGSTAKDGTAAISAPRPIKLAFQNWPVQGQRASKRSYRSISQALASCSTRCLCQKCGK
ncbi:hypothetical protein WDZ92_34670, partial [Nostoc sp. NIES-2111]